MKTKSIIRLFALFLAVGMMSCGGDNESADGSSGGTTGGGSTGGGNTGGGGTGGTNITSVTLEPSETTVFTGTDITFTVRDQNLADVTSQAAITLDGVALTGNSWTSSAVATYTAKATVGTVSSSDITLSVVSPTYTSKVLIEDYTGTWCGYCVRMTTAIQNVHTATNNAIAVAIHDDNDMPFPFVNQLAGANGVTGFPTGKLNRKQHGMNQLASQWVLNLMFNL